ncbi:hypothetical protein BEP19_02575 [Ammoniphilus oxalaticus]|uniref:L,D-TPase catalytic domain-containing protein n=1 Tax=Ammoniphilus oxalaticus TaxID=66863 RepID=A0A419SNG9_9BACL|nr:L,D-transpeptidase family protein [Ammoniphilus oxalaticus]RKD25838.1 hypothetical protein BEP19_02575 [Ammoniphilus oxalaticus]
MKKWMGIFALLALAAGVFYFPKKEQSEQPRAAEAKGSEATSEESEALDYQAVEAMVKPSIVFARIDASTPFYEKEREKDEQAAIGVLEAGKQVEILEDRSYEWYRVRPKGTSGDGVWIKANVDGIKTLNIPQDPKTNVTPLLEKQLETYVNGKGLASETSYLIWVDLDRQLTNVFVGTQGDWKLERSILVSTGVNEAPTSRGLFKIGARGDFFYNPKLEGGGLNWVRFNGSYLFHSVTTDRHGNVIDDRLGARGSSGCIRMGMEESEWFYKQIPENTTVFVH